MHKFSPSINHSSGLTVTDSHNLVEELPSSQNSGSFNDAVRDASTPNVGDQFQWAFDASLLHSEGDCHYDPWCKLWLRLVAIKNCLYDLPSGSTGKEFVNLLSSEVNLLAQGSSWSERVLVFLSTMLQQGPMVQKGIDIHHLLSRCLQLWKECVFNGLVTELEWCAKQLPCSRFKDMKDHCVKVFTC